VWIGHLKQARDASFKLPATQVLAGKLGELPEIENGWQDIRYEEKNQVGYLSFDFYNGAMGSTQCERLRLAYLEARKRDTRVLVLLGGEDFWCNGIHLNLIEAADSPADESWRNINAMNDLAHAILTSDDKLVIAALRGNAGAGGVFLALAADQVAARRGVVLTPHYKAMGNLYGSEYWSYSLPRRVGTERARAITENRLPLGATLAGKIGLIDACFGDSPEAFRREVETLAQTLATAPDYALKLAAKQALRARDEAKKPLCAYRAEELAHMALNFYGFDPSYHVARYHFVHKLPHSHTPRHLALHRRIAAPTGDGKG
jgi:putative two-component system protein, hydrogenase maturation factor HypX/HoxX